MKVVIKKRKVGCKSFKVQRFWVQGCGVQFSAIIPRKITMVDEPLTPFISDKSVIKKCYQK
jgi:hypothetical protein